MNRFLVWEWSEDVGGPWEPQADRILGLYLAPFSGISHREQKQPSRAAPSEEYRSKIQCVSGLDCRAAARGPEFPVREGGS